MKSWSARSNQLWTRIDMQDDTLPKPNLAELYIAIGNVHADTKDIVADDFNPHFKNKFASLSAHLSYLKPLFHKHGLTVIQLPTSEYHDNGIGIKTIIAHKNGTSIESSCVVPVGEQATGQQAGAILTYLRRYCLASIGGLATADDDAEVDRVVKTASAPLKKSAPDFKPATFVAPHTGSVGIDFELAVPFGNNKGTALSALADKDLDYWANKWEPKPWEKTGKVGAKDQSLKKSAQALWVLKQNGVDSEPESQDEVPF
jgi:hypothetical protein